MRHETFAQATARKGSEEDASLIASLLGGPYSGTAALADDGGSVVAELSGPMGAMCLIGPVKKAMGVLHFTNLDVGGDGEWMERVQDAPPLYWEMIAQMVLIVHDDAFERLLAGGPIHHRKINIDSKTWNVPIPPA